ncbi:acyltransferase family protein [Pseudomonas sp.]|uniref:acyltransferase family protein n=1 Tax=Pseudomonas sp. TaxID=306 RepID=UPI003F3E2305
MLSFPFFFAGCVLAALAKHNLIPPIIRSATSSVTVAMVVLISWLYFRLPLIMIPYGILILALTHSKSPSFLSSKSAIFLGEASYSLYILHFPLYLIFLSYIAPRIQTDKTSEFYIYITILVALSAFTYALIEKPCRSYIRAMGSRNKIIISD